MKTTKNIFNDQGQKHFKQNKLFINIIELYILCDQNLLSTLCKTTLSETQQQNYESQVKITTHIYQNFDSYNADLASVKRNFHQD